MKKKVEDKRIRQRNINKENRSSFFFGVIFFKEEKNTMKKEFFV